MTSDFRSIVRQADAAEQFTRLSFAQAIVTDPPYYDAIDYAGLSDFFYVWLKRSLGFLHPDLLVLAPDSEAQQAVMNVYASEKKPVIAIERKRQRYVDSDG